MALQTAEKPVVDAWGSFMMAFSGFCVFALCTMFLVLLFIRESAKKDLLRHVAFVLLHLTDYA
eukprot:CAMPEP_0197681274 /NCGR_PEP_ID=MMETSP1338-20131121/94661_1 /TAXON_ID=43686 ORGANISM="Pelagodinium beii, Strain RCC1491" /NCGR_SAMPLE_ID=MMETSP1338 /ASSEMBLY_ACC=CAM_ASM_000754 /LENGTH=62 /DNA_ID=CAMNT_0043262591 /DNA_START=20 /DNA_END=204 /DNA_ORIENTATION=+